MASQSVLKGKGEKRSGGEKRGLELWTRANNPGVLAQAGIERRLHCCRCRDVSNLIIRVTCYFTEWCAESLEMTGRHQVPSFQGSC